MGFCCVRVAWCALDLYLGVSIVVDKSVTGKMRGAGDSCTVVVYIPLWDYYPSWLDFMKVLDEAEIVNEDRALCGQWGGVMPSLVGWQAYRLRLRGFPG